MNREESISLPKAFQDKMKRLLGDEYDEFIQSFETERVQGLRLNTLKGDPTKLEELCLNRFGLKKVPWCREGYYYDRETRPGRHPYHEAGVYYIQEPSAMAVAELLDPRPGELVLDLCAAPGGKTTHIAERMAGEGLLVSNEIHPARARILSQNVERMGIANAVVTNADAEKLSGYFPEFFDRIVVDAPCSGEGMFRKDEQARAEWSEDNVVLCAARQQEILEHAAGMLKRGGRLVYSTCTFSPEEDEEGVAGFLKRHPEFSLEAVPGRESLSPGRPEWSRIPCPELTRTFRIWPHRAEGEGHFLAVLKKSDVPENGPESNAERKRKYPKYWYDRTGWSAWGEFAENTIGEAVPASDRKNRAGELPLVLYGDQLYLIPAQMPDFTGLKVLRPGLHLGTFKKNRLEPSHALALAMRPEQVRRSLSLPAESPLTAGYLNGETLPANGEDKGWVLICVDECSLGWAKAASGILKNHYPKGLRIPPG